VTAYAEFPCRRDAVGRARTFVSQELDDLDLDVVRRLQLLVSELATNSVLHARTPFSVSIERGRDHVRIEVTDRGDGNFQSRPRDLGRGHGLHVVQALASRSGFDSGAEGEQVAWVEIALDRTGSTAPRS
jgi:anti-sigma regulatory factor (Ser/Thr protein kinase)